MGGALMLNNEVVGGLVANAEESQVLSGSGDAYADIPRVCADLRVLAEERNSRTPPR